MLMNILDETELSSSLSVWGPIFPIPFLAPKRLSPIAMNGLYSLSNLPDFFQSHEMKQDYIYCQITGAAESGLPALTPISRGAPTSS